MISSGNDIKRPFVVISCLCYDKVSILLSLTVMARISIAVFTLALGPRMNARSARLYAFTLQFCKRAELGRKLAQDELSSLFRNELSTRGVMACLRLAPV